MAERVGFIGLGLMGKPMARNLLAARHALTVHSRSPGPVQELTAEGAAPAASPRAVAEASDVVITMLPDTPDVEEVLFGPEGLAAGASAGSLVVDMSTIDPIATRAFADRLAAQGVGMLDAPVSGGDIGAREGTLSIMVGGSQADFERALPTLRVMGDSIVRVGSSGAGQVAKMCNQLVVAATQESVAEALVLAAKAGVDPAKVREALLGGFAASKVLEVHGRRMLGADFEPGFRSALMHKDGRIVLDAAERLGAPLPVYRAVFERLQRLVDEGRGGLDPSALVTLLEDEAGVRVSG